MLEPDPSHLISKSLDPGLVQSQLLIRFKAFASGKLSRREITPLFSAPEVVHRTFRLLREETEIAGALTNLSITAVTP